MHLLMLLFAAVGFGAFIFGFTTVSNQRTSPGAQYVSWITLTGDANTYPTGGWPLTPALFGFNDSVDFIQAAVRAPAAAALDVQWVAPAVFGTGGNLRLIVSSTGNEVANGASTATAVIDLFAYGR